jgi:small-conductance mechanosensitive channel
MNLKEILNTTLIETQNFEITFYEILVIFIIMVITLIISRVIRRIFIVREKNSQFDHRRSHAIMQIIKYILWISAILISFNTIGIKLTLLLAGSAALLVGLGLGLQQIFQDFMSGLTILFEGTLKVGDVVEIRDEIVGKVTAILLQCAEKQNNISTSPKPFVRFNNFGESSLEFKLFFWTIDTFSVENIKSEIRYKINDAFREQGVQIPFPQRDVHIKS